ncbi:N-acetyltransferase family protein [Pseudaestuariivita sp.]|uniref:N-acetyltransferase family protein n=1 Tax=Pseudaestuariivita sp. TaxID=2211669 RepID=UPI004058E038
MSAVALRPGAPLDAGWIGGLLTAFVEENPWMPRLHTAAEDVAHAGDLIARGWVTVAEDQAFIARDGAVVHALYVDAKARRQGLGGRLLEAAKAHSQELRLWTFQANTGAQAFYQTQGFREGLRTDGQTNDEGLPDIEFVWDRPGSEEQAA